MRSDVDNTKNNYYMKEKYLTPEVEVTNVTLEAVFLYSTNGQDLNVRDCSSDDDFWGE